MTIKIAVRVIAGIILLFLFLYTSVLVFHKQIIFQATLLEQSYEFEFNEPFTEYFIDTPDGNHLSALYFPTNKEAKGLLFYFHGNADNLQRWGNYTVDFTSKGYDVLAIDYQGYGKSTGQPSEEALYANADLIWNWAISKFNYDKKIIYGRSLGTAVASQLAIKVDPALLVLETPFNKLTQNIPTILLPNHLENMFSNEEHLESVLSRVVIIHGDKDRITQLSSAKKLIPFLKPNDEFVLIEGGKHKNLREFEMFHKTLERIL